MSNALRPTTRIKRKPMSNRNASARPLPTDADLLERIGRSQDREAFSELYARYERPGYHLAHHLTSDRASAEEALQDGMLRVWKAAASFRVEGNARGWILRIIARESLKKSRGARARQTFVPLDESRDKGPARDRAVEHGVEREELHTAVRSSFNNLPHGCRQLLSLYYLAGLSQREIGELLSMPQTSVSDRIERALQKVKAELKGAGLAAVPLLQPQSLSEILTTGLSIPSHLRGQILSKAQCRAATNVGAASFKALLIGAPLALIMGSVLYFTADPPDSVQVISAKDAPATGQPVEANAKGDASFSYRWTFNEPGVPKEFEVQQGGWKHLPRNGSDGTGCLMVDHPELTLLRFKPKIQRFPVEISFRYQNVRLDLPIKSKRIQPENAGYATGIVWSVYESKAALFHNVGTFDRVNDGWGYVRVIVTRDWIDRRNSSQRVSFMAGRPGPHARLELFFRRMHLIDDLCIRSLSPKKVPEATPLMEALERIPKGRRTGNVKVPGLKSMRPPKPVSISFQ